MCTKKGTRTKKQFVAEVIIWIICATGFLYQTVSMFRMYFQYPFSVTLIEEVRKNIMFPALTVCLHRWISISRLCAYKPTCELKNQIASEGKFYLQWDPIGQEAVSHEPKELIICQMRSTVSSCMPFECTEFMKRTYFRPPADMCFTLDNYQWLPPDHQFKQCASPWNYELELSASWNPNQTMALRESQELPLIVHRPFTVPPDRLSSILLEPGFDYTITVSQQKLLRLPAPYSSDCTDYMAKGKYDMYFGYMTQDICVQECKMKVELKVCQCIRSENEFGARFSIKQICDLLNDDLCARKLETFDAYDHCHKQCKTACEEIVYDVRLTSLTGSTLIEAFGYTGGYMGIWLGFSLLSTSIGLYRKLLESIFKKQQPKQQTIPVQGFRQPFRTIPRKF